MLHSFIFEPTLSFYLGSFNLIKEITTLVLLDALLSILKLSVIKCIPGEILSDRIILRNCFACFWFDINVWRHEIPR